MAGVVEGAAGKTYTNRTDLNGGSGQAVQVPQSLPYGQGAALRRQQEGAPMHRDAPAPGPLSAPSGRPGEPVTAGLSMGAGVGGEALPIGSSSAGQLDVETLRRLYQRSGSPNLRRMYLRMSQVGV